eukprot:g955.t1
MSGIAKSRWASIRKRVVTDEDDGRQRASSKWRNEVNKLRADAGSNSKFASLRGRWEAAAKKSETPRSKGGAARRTSIVAAERWRSRANERTESTSSARRELEGLKKRQVVSSAAAVWGGSAMKKSNLTMASGLIARKYGLSWLKKSKSMPEGWEKTVAPDGKQYFFNRKSQQTSWIKPKIYEDPGSGRRYIFLPDTGETNWLDSEAHSDDDEETSDEEDADGSDVRSSDLPAGWDHAVDNTGRSYYYNLSTGETRWNPPASSSSSGAVQTHTDPATGRRYQYNQETGETKWIDSEEDDDASDNIGIATDPATGKRYSYNKLTGKTTWLDDDDDDGASSNPNVQTHTDPATGKRFTHNKVTGETRWVEEDSKGQDNKAFKDDLDEHEEGLPEGWFAAKDAQGNVYYYHPETSAVTWTKPEKVKKISKWAWVRKNLKRLGALQHFQDINTMARAKRIAQRGRRGSVMLSAEPAEDESDDEFEKEVSAVQKISGPVQKAIEAAIAKLDEASHIREARTQDKRVYYHFTNSGPEEAIWDAPAEYLAAVEAADILVNVLEKYLSDHPQVKVESINQLVMHCQIACRSTLLSSSLLRAVDLLSHSKGSRDALISNGMVRVAFDVMQTNSAFTAIARALKLLKHLLLNGGMEQADPKTDTAYVIQALASFGAQSDEIAHYGFSVLSALSLSDPDLVKKFNEMGLLLSLYNTLTSKLIGLHAKEECLNLLINVVQNHPESALHITSACAKATLVTMIRPTTSDSGKPLHHLQVAAAHALASIVRGEQAVLFVCQGNADEATLPFFDGIIDTLTTPPPADCDPKVELCIQRKREFMSHVLCNMGAVEGKAADAFLKAALEYDIVPAVIQIIKDTSKCEPTEKTHRVLSCMMSAFENMCHLPDLVDEALKKGRAVTMMKSLIECEHIKEFMASKDRSLTPIHDSAIMMLILMCEGSDHAAPIFAKDDDIVNWVLRTIDEECGVQPLPHENSVEALSLLVGSEVQKPSEMLIRTENLKHIFKTITILNDKALKTTGKGITEDEIHCFAHALNILKNLAGSSVACAEALLASDAEGDTNILKLYARVASGTCAQILREGVYDVLQLLVARKGKVSASVDATRANKDIASKILMVMDVQVLIDVMNSFPEELHCVTHVVKLLCSCMEDNNSAQRKVLSLRAEELCKELLAVYEKDKDPASGVLVAELQMLQNKIIKCKSGKPAIAGAKKMVIEFPSKAGGSSSLAKKNSSENMADKNKRESQVKLLHGSVHDTHDDERDHIKHLKRATSAAMGLEAILPEVDEPLGEFAKIMKDGQMMGVVVKSDFKKKPKPMRVFLSKDMQTMAWQGEKEKTYKVENSIPIKDFSVMFIHPGLPDEYRKIKEKNRPNEKLSFHVYYPQSDVGKKKKKKKSSKATTDRTWVLFVCDEARILDRWLHVTKELKESVPQILAQSMTEAVDV